MMLQYDVVPVGWPSRHLSHGTMLLNTVMFQHDGSSAGRLSGHGARGEFLRLQEPLLRRHEKVVSGLVCRHVSTWCYKIENY